MIFLTNYSILYTTLITLITKYLAVIEVCSMNNPTDRNLLQYAEMDTSMFILFVLYVEYGVV